MFTVGRVRHPAPRCRRWPDPTIDAAWRTAPRRSTMACRLLTAGASDAGGKPSDPARCAAGRWGARRHRARERPRAAWAEWPEPEARDRAVVGSDPSTPPCTRRQTRWSPPSRAPAGTVRGCVPGGTGPERDQGTRTTKGFRPTRAPLPAAHDGTVPSQGERVRNRAVAGDEPAAVEAGHRSVPLRVVHACVAPAHGRAGRVPSRPGPGNRPRTPRRACRRRTGGALHAQRSTTRQAPGRTVRPPGGGSTP